MTTNEEERQTKNVNMLFRFKKERNPRYKASDLPLSANMTEKIRRDILQTGQKKCSLRIRDIVDMTIGYPIF